MVLSKRDIKANLLLNFKKGRKAAETARYFNKTRECSTQKWFLKDFTVETWALEIVSIVDVHLSSMTVN